MNYKKRTRIATLIVKKVCGLITPEEDKRLRIWSTASVENQALLDSFLDQDTLIQGLIEFNAIDTQPIWDRLRVRFPSLPALPKIKARA